MLKVNRMICLYKYTPYTLQINQLTFNTVYSGIRSILLHKILSSNDGDDDEDLQRE